MTVYLHSLSPAALRALASSAAPAGLPGAVTDGALPPPFVAQRSLQQLAAGKSPQWCSTFLIVRDADAAVVGACGFKDEPAHRCVEIGYGVAPALRRQGIATGAVSELLRLAFASSGVDAVLAQVNPDNLGSTRVVQSLGFEALDNVIDDEGEPLVQWIIRRSSFAKCDLVSVGS